MAEPRVSVLIGTWNNAGTLPRAIDSILAQTLEDLELIVVDDGSTDETPEIVAAIEDPRVRYLPLPHMGISRSLNEGLDACRAEIVAVQDADDWSLPERLDRQVAALDEDPTLAVIGCFMREVDERGSELTPRQPRVPGDVRRILHRFNPIPNTAAAFRREVALGVGGFDPTYRYAMDYDLWQRIASDHGVANLPEVLAVRRLAHSNAGARNERAQIRETLRIRLAWLRRSRRPVAITGLVRPTISYALPLDFKRALRRLRGQAP